MTPSPLSAQGQPSDPVISFGDQIRPIFTTHCTACHGGVKQAGDVSFVYRDKVLPPDGWIVEPGDPESSVLLERVTSDDPDMIMPPPEHGSPLSAEEIELLTTWIRQGAPWSEHWAYRPPVAVSPPSVRDEQWPRQQLDRFILARLEREGLEPSPEASPDRWLRRVCLDLLGLPPTLEDRKAFAADLNANGPVAYENVVDRLLESPHFGERWASVWLDQVRYADSKGLGIDARRNIWKYRDWVITALNQDLPYDQFTIKQIAGDLLPNRTMEDLIATAVHRLTQTNEEGGTDDEEFRIAAVLDRVSTTWQTWQGVTFGCVQCHSHPYAPFEHDEFYEFAAFFNNTADCDLDQDWPVVDAPLDPKNYDRAALLDRQIADVRKSLWEKDYSLLADQDNWTPVVGLQASSSNATQLKVERDGDHDEYFTVGTVSRNTDIVLQAPLAEFGVGETKQSLPLTAIRLTVEPLDVDKALSDSEWGFVVSNFEAHLIVPEEDEPRPLQIIKVFADEPEPFFDPQDSLNPKSNRGFSAFTRIHYPRQAAFLLEEPTTIPPNAELRVTLKHRVYLLAAFSLISKRGHLAVSTDPSFGQWLKSDQRENLQQTFDRLKKERASIPSTTVPVLQERPEQFARPTRVFERGLFLTKGKQVEPGLPASLPPLPDGMPVNRLALAQWLVAPENPLTARVAVNRFWARLMGIGIVPTEEDFGSSGECPTHPELLDHLALRFQDQHHWSVKKLLREMVLSSTYRQSSKIRSDVQKLDPDNRLLARGPRTRLPAEMVRDQALAVSGLLSTKMFGPPVNPPIPEGVWRPFAAGDKWNTPKPEDENRYRRSIYTYMKRSIPYPMFAAFDAPSREFCTPRRLRSNTPIQALMMLNDQTFVECSAALAKRMLQSAKTPREQIAFGFETVTGRSATAEELDGLLTLYQFAQPESSEDSKPNQSLERVASVLLNLDEFLTK